MRSFVFVFALVPLVIPVHETTFVVSMRHYISYGTLIEHSVVEH